MRLPFFDPPREEVAAVASDLIIRFGLRAYAAVDTVACIACGSRLTIWLKCQKRIGLTLLAQCDNAPMGINSSLAMGSRTPVPASGDTHPS
jgi:hypothetical protein